jgi:hypothetical protein
MSPPRRPQGYRGTSRVGLELTGALVVISLVPMNDPGPMVLLRSGHRPGAAGSGWYDQVNGEIGDICAWHFKKVAGYKVQLEWSNAQNKCV